MDHSLILQIQSLLKLLFCLQKVSHKVCRTWLEDHQGSKSSTDLCPMLIFCTLGWTFALLKASQKLGVGCEQAYEIDPSLYSPRNPYTTSPVFITDNDYSIRWHCNLDIEWSFVDSWSGDLRVNPEREGSSAQRSGDDRQRKLYLSGSPGLPVFLPAQQVLGGAPSCKVP